MNTKKMLAVLVAGACGAPLLASAQDASPITIYGRLYPQYTFIKSTGATVATGPRSTLSGAPAGAELLTHSEVQASNSRLGFRGNDGWAVFSGTSAAAPQLAAVCALLLQKNSKIGRAHV